MGTRAGLIECRNVLYNIQCVGSIGKSLPARIFYSYMNVRNITSMHAVPGDHGFGGCDRYFSKYSDTMSVLMGAILIMGYIVQFISYG